MERKIILIFVLLILLLFCFYKKNENFNNTITDLYNYSNFINNLEKLKKKRKYILLFSGGPTLTKFKKTDIPKHIWDDCYVIALKNSINFLDEQNINVDFFASNFVGAVTRIDISLLKKHKSINIGLNYGKMPELRKHMHHITNISFSKNHMQLVNDNKKGIEFENINNKLYTGSGHIVMELGIPLSIFLEPKNIITIGWDVTNSTSYGKKIEHWDKKEGFINWNNENDIINKFSILFHDYLDHHYNIKIYKLNKESGIKLPILPL